MILMMITSLLNWKKIGTLIYDVQHPRDMAQSTTDGGRYFTVNYRNIPDADLWL